MPHVHNSAFPIVVLHSEVDESMHFSLKRKAEMKEHHDKLEACRLSNPKLLLTARSPRSPGPHKFHSKNPSCTSSQ